MVSKHGVGSVFPGTDGVSRLTAGLDRWFSHEYEDNNKIPLAITSLVDAKAKIDPRIGPIHGVQPNAKAIPNTIGLKIFLLLLA